MVIDKIFRHIPIDRLEFEMTAEKWNYLITVTAGIQKVISSADYIKKDDTLSKFQALEVIEICKR